MPYCQSCGTEHLPSARFCANCGSSLGVDAAVVVPAEAPDDESQRVFAQRIDTELASGGRLESKTDDMAVIIHGRRVNHVLHFLIGIFTFGLWWLVWLVMAVAGGECRTVLHRYEQPAPPATPKQPRRSRSYVIDRGPIRVARGGLIVLGVAAAAVVLIGLAALVAGGDDENDRALDCHVVPLIGPVIADGLTVTGGGSLRRVRAVASPDEPGIWYVAADIQGPGLEGGNDIGTWVVGGLDPATAGPIVAIDGMAREFSEWGVATEPRWGRNDDGAKAARDCVQRASQQASPAATPMNTPPAVSTERAPSRPPGVPGDTSIDRVAGAIAGDRIQVASGATVELMLIDIPVSYGGPECSGAFAALEEALPTGTTVYLLDDGRGFGAGGRLLRYVYRGDGVLVNELIVARGHAVVAEGEYTATPELRERLEAAEQAAEDAKRGVWSAECSGPSEPPATPPRASTPAPRPAAPAPVTTTPAPTATPELFPYDVVADLRLRFINAEDSGVTATETGEPVVPLHSDCDSEAPLLGGMPGGEVHVVHGIGRGRCSGWWAFKLPGAIVWVDNRFVVIEP